MKLGIFQDIHANLPALKKSVEVFRRNRCDKIIHVGDMVGIGPYPKECLDFAYSINEMEFVMGNHDYWYAYGLPDPIPAWMSDDELRHQQWTHEQIGELYSSRVQNWPFSITHQIDDNKKVVFQHYGLNTDKNWFQPIIKNPTEMDLDILFENVEAGMIFYGHQHIESDIAGKSRYVNLGSAGCYNKPIVRLGIFDIANGEMHLEKLSVLYDDDGLIEAFDIRKVPAREFIKKVFIIRNT